MDNQPRNADDLPDEAELSGSLRDAIEQIRRDEASAAMLGRVLARAGRISDSPQCKPSSLPSQKIVPSRRRHRMFMFTVRALPRPPPQRP